jgi:hypothetical protein
MWGEQWVELCYYSCFTSQVVSFGSTKTSKLAVSLFRETTEISPVKSSLVRQSLVILKNIDISKDRRFFLCWKVTE